MLKEFQIWVQSQGLWSALPGNNLRMLVPVVITCTEVFSESPQTSFLSYLTRSKMLN